MLQLLLGQLQLGFGNINFFCVLPLNQILGWFVFNTLKLYTDNLVYNTVQLGYTVAGLAVALPWMPHIIVTLVTGPSFPVECAVLSYPFPSAGGQGQPSAAVAAEDVPNQQGLPSGVERYVAVVCRAFLHNLLCPLEQVFVDDLKVRYQVRLTVTIANYAGINLILDNAVD